MPRPIRNTARMSENVYVDAPNNRLRTRVQMTCAAKAQNPDSAIATYTRALSPEALLMGSGVGDSGLERDSGPGIRDSGRSIVAGVFAATSSPSPPTAK